MIFAAVYLLWSYQRVFFGTVDNPENQKLKDLSTREWAVLLPIVLFVVWIGVYPATFLGKSAAASKHLLEQVQASRRAGAAGEAIRPSGAGSSHTASEPQVSPSSGAERRPDSGIPSEPPLPR